MDALLGLPPGSALPLFLSGVVCGFVLNAVLERLTDIARRHQRQPWSHHHREFDRRRSDDR